MSKVCHTPDTSDGDGVDDDGFGVFFAVIVALGGDVGDAAAGGGGRGDGENVSWLIGCVGEVTELAM